MTEAAPAPYPRRWLALAVLVLPVLIISVDATVLGFAVPSLSESLAPTSSQLLWIIDIYSFVLAALLVTMGVLGDRVGRRRLLMIGAVGFSAASVLAAFATSPEMLIAARALLGVAGATLMPSTLSLIRNLFLDDTERQRAISLWATAFAVGAAIGPIVGGFLLEHFWWGSVFLLGVPVTVALVVIGPRLIPESKDPDPGEFDLPSAALSMLTMLPAVYAIKMAAEHGIDAINVASLALGVVCGVLFVRRQLSIESPMIDVSLFASGPFRMAVSGNLLACFGFAGSGYIAAQHLQLVTGMTPLRAGMQLLPSVVATIVAMMGAPAVAKRVGPFTAVAGALGTAVVGFVLLSQITADESVLVLTVSTVLLQAGLGAAMTVSVDGIIASVAPDKAGAGAAVSETANELGVALGTAVLGSLISTVYRPRIDDLGLSSDVTESARETLASAIATAQDLGGELGVRLSTGAEEAFVAGSSIASITAGVALTVVAIWAAITARKVSAPQTPVSRSH